MTPRREPCFATPPRMVTLDDLDAMEAEAFRAGAAHAAALLEAVAARMPELLSFPGFLADRMRAIQPEAPAAS